MPRRRHIQQTLASKPDNVTPKLLKLLEQLGNSPVEDGEVIKCFLCRGTPANMDGTKVIPIGHVRVVDGEVVLSGLKSTPQTVRIADSLRRWSIPYRVSP